MSSFQNLTTAAREIEEFGQYTVDEDVIENVGQPILRDTNQRLGTNFIFYRNELINANSERYQCSLNQIPLTLENFSRNAHIDSDNFTAWWDLINFAEFEQKRQFSFEYKTMIIGENGTPDWEIGVINFSLLDYQNLVRENYHQLMAYGEYLFHTFVSKNNNDYYVNETIRDRNQTQGIVAFLNIFYISIIKRYLRKNASWRDNYVQGDFINHLNYSTRRNHPSLKKDLMELVFELGWNKEFLIKMIKGLNIRKMTYSATVQEFQKVGEESVLVNTIRTFTAPQLNEFGIYETGTRGKIKSYLSSFSLISETPTGSHIMFKLKYLNPIIEYPSTRDLPVFAGFDVGEFPIYYYETILYRILAKMNLQISLSYYTDTIRVKEFLEEEGGYQTSENLQATQSSNILYEWYRNRLQEICSNNQDEETKRQQLVNLMIVIGIPEYETYQGSSEILCRTINDFINLYSQNSPPQPLSPSEERKEKLLLGLNEKIHVQLDKGELLGQMIMNREIFQQILFIMTFEQIDNLLTTFKMSREDLQVRTFNPEFEQYSLDRDIFMYSLNLLTQEQSERLYLINILFQHGLLDTVNVSGLSNERIHLIIERYTTL